MGEREKMVLMLVLSYSVYSIIGDMTCITLQVFHGQPMPATVAAASHPPAMRPRVRARRGQATDPHSIAERVSLIYYK